MKNLVQKVLVASAVATAAVTTATTATFAQSAPVNETVNFQGTVGSSCSLANPVDGTLVVDPVHGTSVISSWGTGATRAQVELTCTGNAVLSLGLPADNGSVTSWGDITSITDFIIRSDAYITDATGANLQIIQNSDGSAQRPTIAGPLTDSVVVVDAYVRALDGNPVPDGFYSYNVTVTATPQ